MTNKEIKKPGRGTKRSRPASATRLRPSKKARTARSKSASKAGSADPSKKLRVGILLTYPKLEVKKEELISHKPRSSLRPWTKLAPESMVVNRKFRREKKVTRHPMGNKAIPTDVAVACYIQHAYKNKNVEVDMILPHEISEERLKSNDLNFMMIYDILEAFHTDKTQGKKVYHTLKKCLDSADNVYPPQEYSELIYSKIKYYNYLKENGISIAPTITMTTEEYQAMGPTAALEMILSHAGKENWKRFICKPVYGMEGIDAKFFEPTHKRKLGKYLERCMKKYPGIVVQKEIPFFGNSRKSPELRMYYVGNKYQYSACANENTVVRPRQEGGGFDVPLESLKRRTRSILKRLPKIVMKGKQLPRLLTRLDMGYIVDGNYNPFVNEVEFVPSWYSEDCAHHPDRLIDVSLGDQMVKITKMFVKA